MPIKLGTSSNNIELQDNIGFVMSNSIEFKQASMKKAHGAEEVFVLNQSSPVYVKNEALITGDDIISVEANEEDDSLKNSITIKLTPKGMELVNKVAKDKDFPMLVFFVNGKSIRAIHHVSEIDRPEMIAVIDEDKDFVISIAELIKSGMGDH